MLLEQEIVEWVRIARQAIRADWPKDLPLPEIPEWRVGLMYAAMKGSGYRSEELVVVGQAALFIEWGLWLHDALADTERVALDGALRVLYGDALSSRYVRVLAEGGQVAMIGRFAAALERIHAAKALRYSLVGLGESDAERAFELDVAIHAELPLALTRPNAPIRPLIVPAVSYALLFARQEREPRARQEVRLRGLGARLGEDFEGLVRTAFDEGTRLAVRALAKGLPKLFEAPEPALGEGS
ncbi:MAG: heptaprenyl diphosphate synthase component 1 [Hydrogenibacillus sp.]|nr:heptaprenyl diphosphate synthase component 1 [Hydrogenibacillus sp.]